MRESFGSSVFKLLIGFFAGIIATLTVLAPGKFNLGDFLDKEKRTHWPDFNQAADRVEQANDMAWFYAAQARKYIKQKIED